MDMVTETATRDASAAEGAAMDRGGRPARTSAYDLSVHAHRLFAERGYEETSVEDIAAAAGVSRRTFFRYFPSKADVVWVISDAQYDGLSASLAAADPDGDIWQQVIEAFLVAFTHTPEQDEWARHRAGMIFAVPAVKTSAYERFAVWRQAVTEFVAARLGADVGDLGVIIAGHVAVTAAVAAHEYWLRDDNRNLDDCMRETFEMVWPQILKK